MGVDGVAKVASEPVEGQARVVLEAGDACFYRDLDALDLELAVVPKGSFKPPQLAPEQPPTADW